MNEELKNHKVQWLKKLQKFLVGKKITKIEYLDPKKSMNIYGWDYQPFEIHLEDGVILTPSADDEGNNAGAIFTNIQGFEVIGVEREVV